MPVADLSGFFLEGHLILLFRLGLPWRLYATFEPPLGDLSNWQNWGVRAGADLEGCPAHFGGFPPVDTVWEFATELRLGWVSSRMSKASWGTTRWGVVVSGISSLKLGTQTRT